MNFAILIICAYLLGSIPFGLIIAAAHGKDLRSIGSGNIGATNLSRAMGKRWAYFCFVLDMLKGLVPMLIAGRFLSTPPLTGQLFLCLATGCAAVAGHIFPVYVKFKGGKGVATSFGVAIGLWPYYTLAAGAALVIWIIFVAIWRYISLASIAGAVVFPITLFLAILVVPGWSFDLWPLLITAILIPVTVIIRHKDNIKRIIAGTESRVFTKQKA